MLQPTDFVKLVREIAQASKEDDEDKLLDLAEAFNQDLSYLEVLCNLVEDVPDDVITYHYIRKTS